MKNLKFLFGLMAVSLVITSVGQENIEFTFNGDNNGQSVYLDSVYIKNLTRNCDTMINTIVGISDFRQTSIQFDVSENYPNPFRDFTQFQITIPEKDVITIQVVDLMGRNLLKYTELLTTGLHKFNFQAGSEICYLIRVHWRDQQKSIKLLRKENSVKSKYCQLNYMGGEQFNETYKSKTAKDIFEFFPGDEGLFIAYADGLESGFAETPQNQQESFTFQFATNIPCIGNPTIEYGGQTYNTVQIYSQCWLKENLNVGEMIPSSESQSNNNTIEKYCMVDDPIGCEYFGGLYFWNEMMNYAFEIGGQGICPDGWHVPADIDWQILEGATDSEIEIGSTEWGYTGWRGNDVGGNLKQTGTELWEPPNTGATDAFGFCALPAGYFVQDEFWGPGYKTYLWCSNYPGKFYRNLDWNMIQIRRGIGGDEAAFSVRCVKD